MTRVARRNPSTPPDPLAEVLFRDAQGIAGDLGLVLDSLAGYDANQVYGVIWKKPDDLRPGSSLKFQYVEDVPAPIDMQEICNSLKTRYGGGDYRLSIYANKVLRKQVEFNIYGPAVKPGTVGAPPAADSMNTKDLFALIMSQQAEARREMQAAQEAARREAAEERRQLADQEARRTDRMMQTIAIVAPIALPLIMGNREKLSDLVAMMRGDKTELKDQVETFVALKGLFGGEGGGQPAGFDPDDVVGSLIRSAGPILASAGRHLSGRGGAQPAGEPEGEAGAPLMLPQPDPPSATTFVAEPASAPTAEHGSPVLQLIRPHVVYFFNARLDPGLAAEAIADILDRQGVSEEDVHGLVAAFALSPDWLADLAAQGIDLRADPEWAKTFLSELAALWQDDHPGDDSSVGGGGGGGDAADHAPARSGRLKANGHTRPGA